MRKKPTPGRTFCVKLLAPKFGLAVLLVAILFPGSPGSP